MASDLSRVALEQPLFAGRRHLVEALTRALEPGRAAALLCVFDLLGAREHRDAHGEAASEALLAGIGLELTALMGGERCYRSRWDEFCVLLDAPAPGLVRSLGAAAATLARRVGPLAIAPSFGAVALPDEADDPVDALILADERAWARRAARGPSAGSDAVHSLAAG